MSKSASGTKLTLDKTDGVLVVDVVVVDIAIALIEVEVICVVAIVCTRPIVAVVALIVATIVAGSRQNSA